MSEGDIGQAPEAHVVPADVLRALVDLLAHVDAVVEQIERDEAQDGGLLSRIGLRRVGELRLARAKWPRRIVVPSEGATPP